MAANRFSTSGFQTANALLGGLPAAQQLSIAHSLASGLRSGFDETAASVVLRLVADQADEQLKQDLVGVLVDRIEQGQPESVAKVVAESNDISSSLLGVGQTRLESIADQSLRGDGFLVTRYSVRLGIEGSAATTETVGVAVTRAWLQFVRLEVRSAGQIGGSSNLLRSALVLLGSIETSIAVAAKDLVFSLLESQNRCDESLLTRTIDALISVGDSKLHQTLGYSLWLRCLAATEPGKRDLMRVHAERHWESIKSGLRHGDAERRKLCLDILKRSVALAIETGRPELVTPDANGTFA